MGTWGDKSGVNSSDAVVDGRLRARPTRLKNMAKAARDAGMPQKRNCRPVVSRRSVIANEISSRSAAAILNWRHVSGKLSRALLLDPYLVQCHPLILREQSRPSR